VLTAFRGKIGDGTEDIRKGVRPKGFFYSRRHAPVEATTIPDGLQDAFSYAKIDTTWALPSRQVEIDGDTHQVGDSVLCKDGKLHLVHSIVTVRMLQAEVVIEATFWCAQKYQCAGQGPLGPVFQLTDTREWLQASNIQRSAFVHHACTALCRLDRKCVHARCPPACKFASVAVAHKDDRLFYVDVDYHIFI